MCLLAVAFQTQTDTPLIVTSNRDEFYRRPTEAMHWWPDAPILAGRDTEAGGTWMGLSRSGRFAAVTNFRQLEDAAMPEADSVARSSGDRFFKFKEHGRTMVRLNYDDNA